MRPRVRQALLRGASQVVKGVGNLLRDAGSRGYNNVLLSWAAALGIRLKQVHLSDDDKALCMECLHIALYNGNKGIVEEPDSMSTQPTREMREAGADGVSPASYSSKQHEPLQHNIFESLEISNARSNNWRRRRQLLYKYERNRPRNKTGRACAGPSQIIGGHHPKDWRAPTRKLAGTNPKTGST